MFRKPIEPPLAAVMGQGTDYEGDLSFEGRVRVDGTFRGRIYTEDVLEVGPSGRVTGDIDVAQAIVAGEVEGTLRARRLLRVEQSGVVRATVDAARLEMAPGAQLAGQVRVSGRDLD